MSEQEYGERRVDYPAVLRLVTRIDERTENTQKDVEKLLRAMFEGNGEPSVLSRLSTLEERSPRKREPAIWGAVGTFLGAMVVGAASVIGVKFPSGH